MLAVMISSQENRLISSEDFSYGVRKQEMRSDGSGTEVTEPQMVLRRTLKNEQKMIEDRKKIQETQICGVVKIKKLGFLKFWTINYVLMMDLIMRPGHQTGLR